MVIRVECDASGVPKANDGSTQYEQAQLSIVVMMLDANELVNQPVHRILVALINAIDQTIQPLNVCVAAGISEQIPEGLLR
jgi:hypothetical protein